jgi:succinate dehydrogenase / fumarate reductase flavoprotein subunit
MARNKEGLTKAIPMIRELREQYWKDVKVLGRNEEPNQALERASRVADFFELGELMCVDALNREESCGGHFRTEYQTPDGEAKRNDDDYAFVSAWEFKSLGEWTLHKEPLNYENIKLATRSYK